MNRRLQRLLLGCVVSNALFGGAGIALLDRSTTPTTVVSSNKSTSRIAAGPTTTVVAPASSAIGVQAIPATSAAPSSARRGASTNAATTKTKTTTPASDAVGDVTGITSSTAPANPARIAPSLGSYTVDIAGSASVGGRSQSVPTSGSVIFAAAGNNIRQSSPKTPGDVVLLQRFSGAKSELVTLELTAGDSHKVFTPSAPVTYLLYNAPGATAWNWSSDSSDGKTHVTAAGRVGGIKDITIGGVSVRAIEVIHELTISGDIKGTAILTTWASPEYRLPLVQHQRIDASTRGLLGIQVRLVSDTTTTLRSITPG